VVYPILGREKGDGEVTKRAMQTLKNFLGLLEKKLGEDTFVCGIELTVADILLSCVLLLPFRTVIDAKMQNSYPNVIDWLRSRLMVEKEIYDVWGPWHLCPTPQKPSPSEPEEEFVPPTLKLPEESGSSAPAAPEA
jgi:hypothetical protein